MHAFLWGFLDFLRLLSLREISPRRSLQARKLLFEPRVFTAQIRGDPLVKRVDLPLEPPLQKTDGHARFPRRLLHALRLLLQEISVFVLHAQHALFVAARSLHNAPADRIPLSSALDHLIEKLLRLFIRERPDRARMQIFSFENALHAGIVLLLQKRIVVIAHAPLCPAVFLAVRLEQIGERLARVLPRVNVLDQSHGLFFRVAVDFVHHNHLAKILDIILSRYTFYITMHVYFLADQLCALSVNGLFLGTVDGFERSAEISPQDACFVEFKPVDRLPIRFRFDENFLLAPPPGVRLYYTRNGLAVYCSGFPRSDPAMRIVKQSDLQGVRLTLFVQGRVQLSVQNDSGFRLVDLDDALEQAEIFAAGDCFLLEAPNAFCILSRTGEILVQADGTVSRRGRVVAAEIPFRDSLGHSALCEWENGKLTACSVRARREPTPSTFALALFESALIGADCTPFLAECLKEKAHALKEFLGAFVSVVLTDDPEEVGLVYPGRCNNVFDVRYFRVTLEDGKISNITPSDT